VKYRPGQDWSYEEEYQLVLDNYMMDFRAPESRMLPHRFADLSGVTFGIRTPMNAKVEICSLLRMIDRNDRARRNELVRLGPPARYSPSSLQRTHAGMSRVGPPVPPARQLQCR
jgi:hypothetical protein